MTNIQKQLLYRRAEEKSGIVEPCGGLLLANCFTETLGKPTLWYNDEEGSTHIVQEGESGANGA